MNLDPTSLPEPLRLALRTIGADAESFEVLVGDVSPRRYLRVHQRRGPSLIAAHYPAELRTVAERFLSTTELLTAIDIRVPAIVACDLDAGWMLLEDLGNRTLFDDEPTKRSQGITTAARMLERFGALDRARIAATNPPLDSEALRRELRQTEAFVLHPLGLREPQADYVRRAFDDLCEAIGSGPLVPCHRDFMARNLILLESGVVAVLDHQDLRLGPAAYDLASLLNDSYFADSATEDACLTAARPPRETRELYDMTAVQRTLKATGTFAAFARRGSPRHLPLVQPTFERACRQAARLPKYAELAQLLADLWTSAGADPALLLH